MFLASVGIHIGCQLGKIKNYLGEKSELTQVANPVLSHHPSTPCPPPPKCEQHCSMGWVPRLTNDETMSGMLAFAALHFPTADVVPQLSHTNAAVLSQPW